MSDELEAPSLDAPEAVADGAFHSLDPRHVQHSRLIGGVVALAISLGLLMAMFVVFVAVPVIPSFVRWLAPLGVLIIILSLGTLVWRWPEFEHHRTAYRVDHDGIEIRKGVLWRSVVNVPRSRIQHTDVSQGPIERNFELSTLHVFTAGTEHSEVTLAGLERARALRIRDHLITGGEHDGV